MSPEYAMEGIFSVKSDTYSFGILLLEIVSGLKISSPHHLVMDFSNLISFVSVTYCVMKNASDSNNSTRNAVLANINYKFCHYVSGMELVGRWQSGGFRGPSRHGELLA